MVDVILTAWKRPHLLVEQLKRIEAQSENINRLIIWQNEQHFVIPNDLRKKYDFDIILSSRNLKFHGRFTLPLVLDSEYVAIFDDDTMPNKDWLTHARTWCDKENAIIGANGRHVGRSIPCGLCDGHYNDEAMYPDIVGHCWFVRREWIPLMWKHRPPHFENGEDIHLAASLNIELGIKCCLPPQPKSQPIVWADTTPGVGDDPVAQHKNKEHRKQRADLYQFWKEKGWKID